MEEQPLLSASQIYAGLNLKSEIREPAAPLEAAAYYLDGLGDEPFIESIDNLLQQDVGLWCSSLTLLKRFPSSAVHELFGEKALVLVTANTAKTRDGERHRDALRRIGYDIDLLDKTSEWHYRREAKGTKRQRHFSQL